MASLLGNPSSPHFPPFPSGFAEDWDPKFLCYSIRGPIILSDGRVTTCTLDHEGQNAIGNIHDDDFETIIGRYGATRLSAMEDPASKPMCFKCYHKLPRWKEGKVPRADWINRGCSAGEKKDFLGWFDPHNLRINLELSSHCNLRCIGCSVAHPEFRDTRRAPNIDLAALKRWAGGNVHRISHVRLYHMGETWLHPEWDEICRFLKAENPAVSLFTSTNGMLMPRNNTIERALDSGIDHIMFSIHGARQASTEKYMGAAFQIETALRAARELATLRNQRRSRLYLSWKYVIFSWNDSEEEIREAIRLCDESGFDELHFSITSQPSPSKRLAKGTAAWSAFQQECASLWNRAADYQKIAPMSAIYPGLRQRRSAAPVPAVEPLPPAIAIPPAAEPAAPPTRFHPGNFDLRRQARLFLHRHLPINQQIRKGIDSVRQGRPHEGVRRLKRMLIFREHGTYELWLRLGEAHLMLRDYSAALEAYDRAVSLRGSRGSELPYLGRARALRGLGRWSEAYAAYENALQGRLLAPERSDGEDIYLEMADVLRTQGNAAGVRTNFRLWRENFYVRHISAPRSIYCPIPENACAYLKTAFVQNSHLAASFRAFNGDAHQFLRDPQNKFRLQNLDVLGHPRYLSFIVLRNPFDRLASAYHGLFVRPLKWTALPDPGVRAAVIEIQRARGDRPDAARSATFEEFVHYVARTADVDLDSPFRPQRAFYDSLEDFDFVGRVEAMDEVRSVLADKLKWSFVEAGAFNPTLYANHPGREFHHRTAPHVLQKMDLPPRPRQLFTASLQDLVRERYAADFAALESAFGTTANPS